jgi:hypothetical protein
MREINPKKLNRTGISERTYTCRPVFCRKLKTESKKGGIKSNKIFFFFLGLAKNRKSKLL